MLENVKITKETTNKELVDIIKDIIWENQGIDSYSILAKLISLGYEYKGRDAFKKLLSDREILNNVLSTKSDKYAICRPLEVQLNLVDLHERSTCIKCEFCTKVDSYYKVAMVMNSNSYDNEDKYFCSLDQTLLVVPRMNRKENLCPLNIAIKLAKSQGETT